MDVRINEQHYELIENYKNAYDETELINRADEYFTEFDYILGDYAYGKLRLKGFYDQNSKKVNKINNFANKNDYLTNFCAYECKYFVLKKKTVEKE